MIRSARQNTAFLALLVACANGAAAAAEPAPLAHALFQDHAVIQRDKPIVVWGRAKSGERITVGIASATNTVIANAAGRWTATLPSMTAGGPHTLSVRSESGATQRINDVLIGDVWLCSGQSNMVLPVHRALDARAETANSANNSIRMLTVPQASHSRAQDEFAAPVQWRIAGPTTVPEFSAACLFFARELQKSVKAPMGLIAAAWGGSKIQTWMSAEALRATRAYDAGLEVLALYPRDPLEAHARWGAVWESWWRERFGRESQPWSAAPRGEWRSAPIERGHWENWGEPDLATYNGMLWYRTTLSLSAAQAAQEATLSLGLVDEVEQTWINGEPLGAHGRSDARHGGSIVGPGPERTYRLPRGAFRAGENVIVINVLDTYATGGLHGSAEGRGVRFANGETVRLDGEWRYQRPTVDNGQPPRAPWEPLAGLGVIYNAMIAPLGNLQIRGVAWYQGESNTDDPARYEDLLTQFMADWRTRFGADLPFLVVQLANYGEPPTTPAESAWAALREAQRLAVAKDARAGLAVTIDIGDRYDVHPANKQEVGRRLARAARRVAYGETIAPSGPRPVAARNEGSTTVVAFTDVGERLIAYSAEAPIGFELCGVGPGSCRYAQAQLDANRVILRANVTAPRKVRYCWADSPVCTLFDAAHLPAVPFEIEVQ